VGRDRGSELGFVGSGAGVFIIDFYHGHLRRKRKSQSIDNEYMSYEEEDTCMSYEEEDTFETQEEISEHR
jgi:hypothetical protein